MGVDEHTIELAGAPVFYRSAAHAGPTPLYLHGVPTSSDDWTPFLERAGGVAPDLLGFGRSGKGTNLDLSFQGLAEFVEDFVAALGLERIALVTHDWGSAIGLVFAQRRPELIERVVVINGVPLWRFRWHRYARLWRVRALGELAMGFTNRWALRRALREGSRSFADPRAREVWSQFDQGTQRAILRLYRSADGEALELAGAGLPALDRPALVLWGDADPWLAVELGAQYAQRLPDAAFELVAGAGHWPWLEQPAVIDRVADFLTA